MAPALALGVGVSKGKGVMYPRASHWALSLPGPDFPGLCVHETGSQAWGRLGLGQECSVSW